MGSKTCILLSLCVGSWLEVAQAECTRPDSPLPITAGASATRDEMVDAMHRVRAYTDSMNAYFNCLSSEADQQEVGATVAEQGAAQERRSKAHNTAVTELIGITNCFNEELRIFREGGGGAGGVEVDCSPQIAAAEAGAEPNSTIASVPVVETEPIVAHVATGEWSYLLRRGGALVVCGDGGRSRCEVSQLIIRNDSAESLRCDVGLSFPQRLEISGKAALRPHSERAALREPGSPDEPPNGFRAECTGFPPVPELTRFDECNFRITKPVDLSDYFPASAIRLHRGGQAMIEFSLNSGDGKASALEVVESSLYDDLDAAAVSAIAAMTFNADCSGHRHRLGISFELSDL